MSSYITIFCTVPTKEVASDIADKLVNDGLAACVNILPEITSIYKWKGEICNDKELLLIIKSSEDQFDNIRKEIIELHPYEVPEVISIMIESGHEPYLNWIGECLKG
ncbi:divalent-cation tolerance protein CutA [Spirochaetota bacterium]